MSGQFTAAFFSQNRQNLRNLFTGIAPIVLAANGLLQSSADMTYPFRQDRNFWYLTGIDEPGAVLVMDKAKEYIILSEDYEHRAKFDGALTAEHIAATCGITEILNHKDGWARLNTRLKKVKHVASLSPRPVYVQYYGFYTNPSRAMMIERIKSVNSKVEVLDLRQHVAKLRMVKQPVELVAIKQAITITARTLKAVTNKTWTERTTESDIDNELLYQFHKKGADGLAFNNVVAAGSSAVTIHHMHGSTKLPKNGLLLLDVGAEFKHYAADITRVYAVGKPTKRMQQVHASALDALDHALSLLKPGVMSRDFEKEMERYVGEKLRELGLIKTIDKESVRRYFPTFTSHHLGLDPHDASDPEKPLSANMVLAVEPGIYIPEEGIGIRVEEDVLITLEGNEILTSSLPRDLLSLTMKQV